MSYFPNRKSTVYNIANRLSFLLGNDEKERKQEQVEEDIDKKVCCMIFLVK